MRTFVEVDIEDVISALRDYGAHISWESPPEIRPRIVLLNGQVDEENCANKLADRGWFDDADESPRGDERDVRDFVQACASADISTACWLAPRVFVHPSELTLVETTLRAALPS